MQRGQQNGGSTEESMGRPNLRAFFRIRYFKMTQNLTCSSVLKLLLNKSSVT